MISNDRDFDEFREVVAEICDKSADAVFRYYDLTSWDPKWVPESFIQAYILDRVGARISMNLEISLPLLWRWTGDQGAMPADLGRKVVDFVINKNNKPIKSEQDIWGIAELKRHNDVSRDRDKLQQILPHFKACRFGVAIGTAELVDQQWLDQEALREGRHLVRSSPKTQEVDGRDRTFFGFGYIHVNPACVSVT